MKLKDKIIIGTLVIFAIFILTASSVSADGYIDVNEDIYNQIISVEEEQNNIDNQIDILENQLQELNEKKEENTNTLEDLQNQKEQLIEEAIETGDLSKLSDEDKREAIVRYACSFVGNPYVWGGESLTKGVDCSGFTMKIYEHFGYSIPRSSGVQRLCGTAVSGDLLPGDIVCYSGHVAIYIGDGKIVHASNKRDGIKISNNYAYRTVVSIRRIV